MKRAMAELMWSGPRTLVETHAGHSDTIARILGARAWLSLVPAIRARFERVSPALYRGRARTALTPLGRVFAWGLFPFGAPLPVLTGEAQTLVQVSVGDGGMSWTRATRGPFGLTFQVRSIKRPSQDGRLLECCAGGWTMLLDLFVDAGALVFRSRQFFWRMGGVSIPIPLWLTPGTAEVRHTDLAQGRFRFTLSFDHPWFGRTVFQDGVFQDPTD
jgi:Domain of unknown function (DUF4166)